MDAMLFVPPPAQLPTATLADARAKFPLQSMTRRGEPPQSPQFWGLASLMGGLGLGLAGKRERCRWRLQKTSKNLSATAVIPRKAVSGGMPAIENPPEDLSEQRKQAGSQLGTGTWPAPENDRLLRAARGEPVDRPPKWMMRQAGRYLPEYMKLLDTTDFFTVCHTPALAAEITLQPFRRYPTLDSLIIFSDILVIPVAMGMACHMEPKVGPKFEFALSTPDEMDKLNLKPDVESTLGFVFDAVYWTRQRVENKVPVIGFAGAPWTLMGYMIEGGAVRSFDRAKKWLYQYPESSRKLLTALRDIVVEYLVGQYDAGAPLLTVFDTNCGELPPSVYEEFCVDDLKYIATEVKRQRPHALMSVFPKDGEIACFNDSDFDVVGVSWTASPAQARKDCPDKTLQGNLDPFLLYAEPAEIHERAQRMVREFGIDRYIANLGHGMLPSHPVQGPAAFIGAVDASTRDVVGAASGEKLASSAPPLSLHLQDETTMTVPVSKEGVEDLKQSLAGFIAMFKEKMAAKVSKRWDSFEYEWSQADGLRLEVFCNPNAFATIFDVKMLLTVRCGDQIKVMSELPLSSLQSDLDAFQG